MNWKLVFLGAVVFWLAMNVLAFGTGPVIHNNILAADYDATASFWRPELNQDPPDMAALMPRWLLLSFIVSLVVAGIYACVHRCFNGPGWKRGMTWGLSIGLFAAALALSYSGVFALPLKIWIWWGIEGIVLYALAGAAMGWAGEKWAGG